MAKQRASKKSVKKAPAAKKKSAPKKKPVQKSAKSSKPVSGKKSSVSKQDEKKARSIAERIYNETIKLIQTGVSVDSLTPRISSTDPIAFKLHNITQGTWGAVAELLKNGFPAKDIQVVIRYRAAGGMIVDAPIKRRATPEIK